MKIYGNTEENEDSLLTCGNKGDQTVDENNYIIDIISHGYICK